MSLLPQKTRSKPFINIVPLIDVLIVLIFFILMTMQFRNINLLNITPPKMDAADSGNAENSISIAIDAKGDFFYNNIQIKQEELEDIFQKAAKENNHQTVIVLADELAAIKYMTAAMDASRKAGLEKVRLQMR